MSTIVTPESESAPPPRRRPWYRRRWFIVSSIVVVLLGAVGGGAIWWYLRDDAPPAVNLESAAESLTEPTAEAPTSGAPAADTATAATSASSASAAPESTGAAATSVADATGSGNSVEGSWSVDTSIGEFSFENSTGTFVGFRVQEELSSIGSTTAVGRTPTVTGSITIDGTTLSEAMIEADMTAIATNDNRRDDRVQDALETSQFPTATFTLIDPIDLGAAANNGAPVSVDATGDLTIHGVTTEVTLPLEAQVVDGTVVVVGSLGIDLSTYAVEAPSAPIVVSVSDQATIEFQLFFSRS